MAKSSNQKLKIMYLSKILEEKTDNEHGLTMSEIIAELDRYGVKAERKSIYDDLEALNYLGMDVEKELNGNKTTYYLASRTFELPELKLLVDAVQSSRFITRKKSEALINKIEGLVSVHEAKKLARQVHVSNRIKTMNESIYYTVDEIHSAINGGRKISFQYFKWNEKMEKIPRHDGKFYVVSPWALMWDDKNYYLVAYDSETNLIKHYRVDKMMKLTILEDKRDGEEHFEHFDMALYSKKTFGMYGGSDEHVTLHCTNDMADAIIDRFGQDVLLRKADEDSFDVTVKVSVSPVFLTWILNFGGQIRITGPQHVIDAQKELVRKSMDL